MQLNVRKNTGALQGTVLALCMYTQNTDNAYPLVKYADDSVIFGMVNNDDESGYLREIVEKLCTVVW